jgi:hypothetical protein
VPIFWMEGANKIMSGFPTAAQQEQYQKSLQALFGEYLLAHPGMVAICSLNRQGAWKQEFVEYLDWAIGRVGDLLANDCDVFFAVNPVKRAKQPRRNADGIQHLLRLHVDADFTGAGGLRRLQALQPSLIVASGTKHRYHAYWNFQEPLDRQAHGYAVQELNARLTEVLGLKKEAHDIARTLRVPGTLNFKNRKNPRQVEIVEWNLERKYTLEQCANLLGAKASSSKRVFALRAPDPEQSKNAQRGRYLSLEDRMYLNRLLQEGLFEEGSRNRATLLLIRHYYEKGDDEQWVCKQVMNFFEHRSNGLSKEWRENPDRVRAKIRGAVTDWFKKAYPAQPAGAETCARRLSPDDEAFIEGQALSNRDKLFLQDAMTWILNNWRGDNLVMSVRQLVSFANCGLGSYQKKRQILYDLGIIALAIEHERTTGLATEYKVLYQFGEPAGPARKRRHLLCTSSLPIRIDKMLRAGETVAKIRERFPTISRQRIYNRKRRLEHAAAATRDQT